MCDCVPGKVYRGGLPTWNPPEVNDAEAICAYNLLGNSKDPCYSSCALFPIPCYGYALNIVSAENWTYPGIRHAEKPVTNLPDANNCQQIISLVEADRSKYAGMAEPNNLNSDEHIFVAYAGGGEYHFARKDTDTNTYSSKNGMDFPTQNDSNNNIIKDPAEAQFSLKGVNLTFCGYFITSNNAVCPTDEDCVAGQNIGGSNPWPGCGQ
jgi:hypothetical protein